MRRQSIMVDGVKVSLVTITFRLKGGLSDAEGDMFGRHLSGVVHNITKTHSLDARQWTWRRPDPRIKRLINPMGDSKLAKQFRDHLVADARKGKVKVNSIVFYPDLISWVNADPKIINKCVTEIFESLVPTFLQFRRELFYNGLDTMRLHGMTYLDESEVTDAANLVFHIDPIMKL